MGSNDKSLLALEIETVYGLKSGTTSRPGPTITHTALAVYAEESHPFSNFLALSEDIRQYISRDNEISLLGNTDEPVGAHEAAEKQESYAFRQSSPSMPNLPNRVNRIADSIAQSLTRTSSSNSPTITGFCSFLITPPIIERTSTHLEGLTVVTSQDSEGLKIAGSAERPSNWEPEEWLDLIQVKLGPWAMAITSSSEVVSICHTPVFNSRAAEVGIWTRSDFRGRGIAAPLVRVWAKLFETKTTEDESGDGGGKVLFYSVLIENQASLSVVEKLGLRFLGNYWTVDLKRK